MAYYLKSGKSFNVTSKEAMDLHDSLPAGNYVIKENPMSGALYLEMIDDFEINGKRYGDLNKNTDRILNTFNSRPTTTGVMLAGEKGSGKSLLAKSISLSAKEMGVPTIVINAPWCGDRFNSFIQSIDQPCVILFDEFEKVYDSDKQEAILTLLDGVFPTKKLFVLTCNDKWRIDSHMRNRPGRIFYMMDFVGLTADFITEYCNDNLENKGHIDKLVSIATLFTQFNFDMLKAVVEEMNRYNEGPEDALRLLNVKPEFDSGKVKYSVELSVAGEPVDPKLLEVREWVGNPLQNHVSIDYKKLDEPSQDVAVSSTSGDEISIDELDWSWENERFMQTDLLKIDSRAGRFVFQNSEGSSVILTRVKERSYNYMDVL
jgi:hypothetical protein